MVLDFNGLFEFSCHDCVGLIQVLGEGLSALKYMLQI